MQGNGYWQSVHVHERKYPPQDLQIFRRPSQLEYCPLKKEGIDDITPNYNVHL